MQRLLLVIAVVAGIAHSVSPPAAAPDVLPECSGEWSRSTWHRCRGTMSFPDGSTYVGDFRAGQFHGSGTYTWPDGSTYVGGYKNDEREGKGSLSQDGCTYIGDWLANERAGNGTQTCDDGKYTGQWRSDQADGQGTFEYSDGRRYDGEFKEGKIAGEGAMTWPDGQRYEGEYLHGVWHGKGVLVLTDGTKYAGEFRKGKLHGYGTEYTSGGLIVRKGYYIDGSYIGTRAPQGYQAAGNRVRLVKEGGTYSVPVTINNQITLNFTVDSGASDVTIPADVVLTLMRTGSIVSGDFIGSTNYQLADGSIITSRNFVIRTLKVGGRTISNVKGSVAGVNGSLLLGQSFLSRFKSWSIDNKKHELVFE